MSIISYVCIASTLVIAGAVKGSSRLLQAQVPSNAASHHSHTTATIVANTGAHPSSHFHQQYWIFLMPVVNSLRSQLVEGKWYRETPSLIQSLLSGDARERIAAIQFQTSLWMRALPPVASMSVQTKKKLAVIQLLSSRPHMYRCVRASPLFPPIQRVLPWLRVESGLAGSTPPMSDTDLIS